MYIAREEYLGGENTVLFYFIHLFFLGALISQHAGEGGNGKVLRSRQVCWY